jgi:GNAT superfamily N-acetyltransferase
MLEHSKSGLRYGCKNTYDDAVIAAWTPEKMPESYRNVIVANPFFVVDVTDGRLGATGFLDLSSGSVEAVFTLPQYTGKGLGSQIIEAIKSEARERGFEQLTLSSTPNAQPFYEKHGFKLLRESMYSSALAQAELRCMEMSVKL